MVNLCDKDDVKREIENHINSLNKELSATSDRAYKGELYKAKSIVLQAAATLYDEVNE
jgi:hypothetical protein